MSEIDVVKGLRTVRERIQAASKNRGPVSKILWHNNNHILPWRASDEFKVRILFSIHTVALQPLTFKPEAIMVWHCVSHRQAKRKIC